MTTTIETLNSKLPRRFTRKVVGRDRLGFEILRTRTFYGPDFYNCHGGLRPALFHFYCDALDCNVFMVGNGIGTFDDSLHGDFIEASLGKGGKWRKVRSVKLGLIDLTCKVYYTRKSAVAAFAKLIDDRNAENAQARKAHADAVAAGDYATASEYC